MSVTDLSMIGRVIHGPGSIHRIGGEVRHLGGSHVLLVTGPHIYSAGLTEAAERSLKENNVAYSVFSEVPRDPGILTVEKGLAFVKENGIDMIVIVGGGSPLCAGKAIALMATNTGSIKDYAGINKYQHPPLPVIAVPTTAGSGSEVSPKFLIDEDDHQGPGGRFTVGGFECIPRLAILDPELLVPLPQWQAVCSSLDTLTMSLEALMGRNASWFSDVMALGALEMAYENLILAACTDDLSSKEKMLLATSMANIACQNAGLGLVHSMTYGVITMPHAFACGVLLPHVLEFNLPCAIPKLVEAARVMKLPVDGLAPDEAALLVVKAIKRLYVQMDFPKRIGEKELPKDQIDILVDITMSKPHTKNNARYPNPHQVKELYLRLYNDWKY